MTPESNTCCQPVCGIVASIWNRYLPRKRTQGNQASLFIPTPTRTFNISLMPNNVVVFGVNGGYLNDCYVTCILKCLLFSLTNCLCTWFERASMLVILLNCVTLGMFHPCEDTDCDSPRCKILQVQAFSTFLLCCGNIPLGLLTRNYLFAKLSGRSKVMLPSSSCC